MGAVHHVTMRAHMLAGEMRSHSYVYRLSKFELTNERTLACFVTELSELMSIAGQVLQNSGCLAGSLILDDKTNTTGVRKSTISF